jgi:alkylhydroperoxidase family enzyme
MSQSTPRIQPLEEDRFDAGAREFLAVVEGPGGRKGGTRLNVIKTLARHPDLAKSYFEFGRYIIGRNSLPNRIRELATLRTALLYGSEYEWRQHSRSAMAKGMPAEDVEAVRLGAGAPNWTEAERAVLAACDQLHATADLDDVAWQSLAAHLDEKQLMDLLFTVGCYAGLAMALNAMRVQPESEPA